MDDRQTSGDRVAGLWTVAPSYHVANAANPTVHSPSLARRDHSPLQRSTNPVDKIRRFQMMDCASTLR
jgi:hypothetical protein